MKMVKSLLLSSAAGVVAVTAGQAADLPVKAKPVEYVKICSLYGAGFYYMPGTDMCIKIGGWVRAEANVSASQTGSLAWGPFNDNLYNRSTNHFQSRARAYITADAREQTAYGTARGYVAVGVNSNFTGNNGVVNNGGDAPVFSANRAFVQWAGITAGLSQSFFDFYSSAAALYRAGFIPSEDTGDAGWWVWAYTAQLGNGFSATISAETSRRSQILQASFPTADADPGASGTLTSPFVVGGGYGGQQVPDVVGNLRLDQTWGSAQVMGAWHQVNPLYYANEANPGVINHPSNESGWVVGAGLKLNFPSIAQGDYFQGEVNYTRGALRYLDHGANTNFDKAEGATQGWGINSDCVFGSDTVVGGVAQNTTKCELTSAWSVNASYEHYWTPQWHQSLAGGYMAVRYNEQANAMLCELEGDHPGAFFGGSLAVANPGCNNNWSVWGIGSRLQWDVTKSFYVGVEVLYTKLHSAESSDGLVPLGAAICEEARAEGCEFRKDQQAWSANVRMHKDFLP